MASKYTIHHGEIGYDIWKDNHPFHLGFGNRWLAERTAMVHARHDYDLERAIEATRKFLAGMPEVYGVNEEEIVQILELAQKRTTA